MLLAVMVDLGWPWWVTTLTAVAAVVAAVLVAVRSVRPELRGAMAPLVIFGIAAAVAAPFVMSDAGGEEASMSAMSAGQGSMEAGPTIPESDAHVPPTSLPFTFFITRYEFLGDLNNPHTVRYHSDGAILTAAADGSSITMTGRGSWDPYTGEAAGGGGYVMKNAAGAVTTKGGWRATKFLSFHQFAGFWGFPIKQELWQGPPGSTTFSGFLKLRVELEGYGSAVLTAWCAMPQAVKAMKLDDDGMTVISRRFRFTDWKANQKGPWGGPMFYGPAASR